MTAIVTGQLKRHRATVLMGLLAVASAWGCGGKEADGPPVATPSLALGRERVAIGSPLRLTYKFVVAQGAQFDGDYTVFAHVLNANGEQMWTDDHLPATPTSKWKPGDTIEYTRTVFVPNYPYIGESHVRVGLYKGEKRLVLSGQDAGRREYVVARMQVLPQSENIFLVDKEGWHPAEVAADNPTSEWNWTQKRAVLSFRNPKRDSLFYMEYDGRPDLFEPDQQVTVRLGEHVLGTFSASSREKSLLTFPIKADQFGSAEMAELSIETDLTFRPGPDDQRELGIRVFHRFVEPQ